MVKNQHGFDFHPQNPQRNLSLGNYTSALKFQRNIFLARNAQNHTLGGSSQLIIPVSKWLLTIVSKSPNWGCSPSKWPKWLINGGYYVLTNWDDPPSTLLRGTITYPPSQDAGKMIFLHMRDMGSFRGYLKDHPKTCKWLGSPSFASHEWPSRDLLTRVINHFLTGMILQVRLTVGP